MVSDGTGAEPIQLNGKKMDVGSGSLPLDWSV